MNINQKSGFLSMLYVKPKADRVKKEGAAKVGTHVRNIPTFYAFISQKKEKKEDGTKKVVGQEIKFRLSKEFAETVVKNRVGNMLSDAPILCLFAPDSDIPSTLFNKKVKEETTGEKETSAIVFRFDALVENLKNNQILPVDFGNENDENFILKLTDITDTYLADFSDEDKENLPADLSVFEISKGEQVSKEVSKEVVTTVDKTETQETQELLDAVNIEEPTLEANEVAELEDDMY